MLPETGRWAGSKHRADKLAWLLGIEFKTFINALDRHAVSNCQTSWATHRIPRVGLQPPINRSSSDS